MAAEAIDAVRQLNALQDKDGAFDEFRRVLRLLRIVSWAALGLVLLGAGVVAAGVALLA